MSPMRPIPTVVSLTGVDLKPLWSGKMEQACCLVEPAIHLTVDTVSDLVDFDYVVGPKADGERALLIGLRHTSDVFLVKMSGSVARVEGARTGPLRGFVLDVEVVAGPGGSQMILSMF